MFLNVDNVGAERMSSGRLFQATGAATQNAQLPSCSLVLGTTKSPRAVERRAESPVGNSGNWNAHLVQITWCKAVDCLAHKYAEFERDEFPCPQLVQMIAE